jgi:hypothetical protein
MHLQFAVVLDEAELAEFVHEVVDAENASTVRSSASWPTWAGMTSRRARRFLLELKSWSTRSASTCVV